MSDIHSRVTLEQIVRRGILIAMVLIFCAYFAYDGYLGYPHRNLKHLKKARPDLVPVDDPSINWAVTTEATRQIEAEDLKRLSDVIERIGQPDHRSEDGSEVFYFGPAVVLKLSVFGDNEIIMGMERKPAELKSEFELRVQKTLALILAVVAIPLLIQYVRVLTFTTRLTDKGIKVSGSPFVPFDAMASMDTSRFNDKGRVDIAYSLDGSPGRLRLDEYWIREFPAVMGEICRRTGFEDPVEREEGGQAAPAEPQSASAPADSDRDPDA
jgi:hypothetical protein